MLTPYPFLTTLRLPLDYLWPSLSGQEDLTCARPERGCQALDGEQNAKIVFVGDLMCSPGGVVPHVDTAVKQLCAQADLVLGNCEGPVCECRPNHRLSIREQMHHQYVTGVVAAFGIEPSRCLLSVANNHSGDRGLCGFEETVEHLRNIGVSPIGLATSPILMRVVKGINLAIVAWTDLMNHNIFAKQEGVARTELILHQPWQTLCHQKDIHCMIGFPHWDVEFRHFPSPATKWLGRHLVLLGFTLIIGHHPHVLQPIELIDGGLVFYSLGNLTGPMFPINWPMRLRAIFEVILGSSQHNRGRVLGYKVHPLVFTPGRNGCIELLQSTTGNLRLRVTKRLGRLFPL